MAHVRSGNDCVFQKAGRLSSRGRRSGSRCEGLARQNRGIFGDDKKIKEFQKSPGISKGPELLANCPTYDKAGSFALNYFGWFSAMILYDGSNKTPFLYEEASSQGYRVNIQLRKGERLTRDWSNKGLHINADSGKVECLSALTGKGALYYTPNYGDLANG